MNFLKPWQMDSALIENKVLNLDKTSWKLTKVGDLAKDISKRVDNPRDYDRFVGLGNFVSGDIKIKTWETTENLASSAKAFKSGDILFARRNAYLRRASLVDFDGCCSGDAFVLKENHDKIVPGFLAFFLNSNALWDYANSNAAGTMSKRVKWRDLAEYELLLPPKDQQAQLAELLWAMYEVVENNIKVHSNLQVLSKSKKKELLVPESTKEWKFFRINELFDKITKKNKEDITDNVLTISAKHGLINQEEYFNRRVSSKNLSNYYLLRKGDFAYNKSYSDGYPSGAIKVQSRYDLGVVSPLYICFRSKEVGIHNAYYEQLFDFGFLNKQILSVAKEGARNHGLLNVSGGDFFDLKIPHPPNSYLKNVMPIIDALDRNEKMIEENILKSRSLLKSIINQIF